MFSRDEVVVSIKDGRVERSLLGSIERREGERFPVKGAMLGRGAEGGGGGEVDIVCLVVVLVNWSGLLWGEGRGAGAGVSREKGSFLCSFGLVVLKGLEFGLI